MLDFGALPPEINSGRMYVGAGSGPMLAAAAAWDSLAADLQSAASSYGSTVGGLVAGAWTGPSSMTMAAAAAPFVTWVSSAAAQAEEAAAQAKLAAGAYETAFAATVPPPIIAANRALLAALVATNFLGQNTPAIAATETHYMEMWAQDAAAMYAYAGSSSTASQLTPFTEPPQTTNTAGTAAQAASVSQTSTSTGLNISTQLSQLITSVPNTLQSLATNTSRVRDVRRGYWAVATTAGGAGDRPDQLEHNHVDLRRGRTRRSSGGVPCSVVRSCRSGRRSPTPKTGRVSPPLVSRKSSAGRWRRIASEMPHLSSAAVGGAPVSGAMGRAALVGSMSVPQGWTQAAPATAIRTLASALPTNLAAAPEASLAGEGGVFSQMGLSSLAGRAMGASATYSGGGAAASSLGGVVEADPAAATIIVIPALED